MIVLNFKSYTQALGENATRLAEIIQTVQESTGARIIVTPQTADLLRVSPLAETFAQHIDPIEPGAGTGAQLAESAKAAGAKGSLLNHSERPIAADQVQAGVQKLANLNMESLVCAPTAEASATLAAFAPTYIAVEPPELIGSGISVSDAKPEVVTQSVDLVKTANKDVRVLCGAGISTGADVKKALELGAEGVLLASAFTKAEDPKAFLEELCGGL